MIWAAYLGFVGAMVFIAMGLAYLVKADDWAHDRIDSRQLDGFEKNAAMKEETQRITKEGLRYLLFGGLILTPFLFRFLR